MIQYSQQCQPASIKGWQYNRSFHPWIFNVSDIFGLSIPKLPKIPDPKPSRFLEYYYWTTILARLALLWRRRRRRLLPQLLQTQALGFQMKETRRNRKRRKIKDKQKREKEMEKKWKKQEERQEIAAGLQQKTEKMCLQKGFCVSSNENQVPYI